MEEPKGGPYTVTKIVHRVKVKNSQGLHARPATMIARILQSAKSQVTLSYRQDAIDARSVMSILMLAIKKNSVVTLTVEGEDAEEILKTLVVAFETQFGEKDIESRT